MRGRINRMRYMAVVILVDYIITGIDATICTDKANSDGFTNVLPMCRSGSLTAGRVVVDTYGTGVLDYDSCQCTVSLSGTNTGPVNLLTGAYPRTAPASDCGSILRFNRHPTNIYTEYQCTRITGDIISNFANNELLNITLSKANNNFQWQSGYCILIRSVLTMCRSGSLTAGRVVVDTYGTGVLDYDSCRCTASLSGTNTGPVNLIIGPYPGTAPVSGCGSILRFNRHPTNTFTEYRCTRIAGDVIGNFANSELLDITLSKVNNSIQWQSGYCILIGSDVNVNVRVTCDSPDTLLASSTAEAVMTTTTTTTTSTTMTTPSTTMTTTPGDVKPGSCKCDQPTIPFVGVVVPIVVTLLVVAVATVANVILYKRRLTMINELKSGSNGMTSQDTVHYDSIDQSRVEPPNTYEEMSTRQIYVNTAMAT